MRGNSEIIQGIKVLLAQGERGSSISTITKTSSSGAVDTYTITLTDGSTSTFQVTNGTPIQSIVLTSSDEIYDTYTVTDASGHVTTFRVKNHDGDMTAFEAEINSLLENTPYLVSVESDELQLPVNTINDNDTSSLSTWSSSKIQSLFDEQDANIEYIPVLNPSSGGGTDKAILSGGCYRLGNIVIVSVTAKLTRKITKSHFTGEIALIPMPEHDETPLSGLYVTANEARYPLTALVRTHGEGSSSYGSLNFGCPDLDLPVDGYLYFGGAYICV